MQMMTDNQYLPAKTVVWRHPCHCPSASRPLYPGEEAEHRFDVDGKPFPWYIAENGASITKSGPIYLVAVEIFPIEVDSNNDVLDVTLSYWRRQVRIGERLFPWAILRGSLVAVMTEADFPMLRLTFLAENVDADVDIPDLDRPPSASRHGNQCATPDCILDAGHPDHHESQHGKSWRTYPDYKRPRPSGDYPISMAEKDE